MFCSNDSVKLMSYNVENHWIGPLKDTEETFKESESVEKL